MINAQVALQAALNELAEMRHELQPFVYETGPARGMVRRIERVQALVSAVREQMIASAAESTEHTTSSKAWISTEGSKARYEDNSA